MFRKIILLLFFSLHSFLFLEAQNISVKKDSFPGWYVDTLHARACHFDANGRYEIFFAMLRTESHEIGSWRKNGDTIFLHVNWYYDDIFNPMCGFGMTQSEIVPFKDTMIADSGNVYDFNDYRDSVDDRMIPWNPSSNDGLSELTIERLKDLHRHFDETIFHPVEMNKSNCDGYYCWHGDHGYESLRLKKSGKFKLWSYSSACPEQNWQDKGKWIVSGDTLILHVRNSKTFGFERAYAPAYHHFYFTENNLGPNRNDPDCAFSKQLYRFSRKKIRKYSN